MNTFNTTPLTQPTNVNTFGVVGAEGPMSIVHGMGKTPTVEIVDEYGNDVECEYEHTSSDTLMIFWNGSFTGKIKLT